MLRRKFKPKSTTQNHNQRRRLLGNYDFRPLLVTAILTTGSWLPILPVLAASPPAGTVIDNQATGSFTDTADNTDKQIESNVVQVTVAEVAGITITANSVPTEAPSGVSGAGTQQGNGEINSGDVVYYEFTLTNVGNDPTQFFLPGAPSAITGGTLQGSMQIIEVDPDGSGATAPIALPGGNPVSIPSGGDRTGSDGAGNNGLLGANGSIPVGGTVKIRVPIKVTATNTGDTVVVVLGDTPVPPNTNTQNQPYTAGNKDVYTLDNPDGTAGEAAGTPLNGDSTNRRQEASASQSLTLTIPLVRDNSGSICSAAGGNLGANLFSNNGSFGTTTGSAGTVGSQLPAGRTNYNFVNNFPPNDGSYTIINQPSSSGFNAWHQPYDHTTGNLTGNMMVVNASFERGVFYQETLNVTPNSNYEFSAWIINILKPQNAGIDPNIAFEVDRIGVDDDNNPNTADGSEGQIIITSGDITESASPTWLNYGTIINSGAATQIVVRFRNNNDGGNGNDLAIDDLMFAPCTPLPSGNISGTLYGDSNTNGNFDSGEPRIKAGVLVQLVNSSGAIIATTQTDNSGNYQFQNIQLGNYTIKVVIGNPPDPDLQGATPSSPSSAQRSASLTTQGQNLNNQNFGFTGVPAQPYLLLVKRITAINGNKTQNPNDNTLLNTFVNDPGSADDDNLNWSNRNTYLIGAYNGGKVKPGDEVEYTIYFLNTGAAANNVTLCDRIPDNMTFVPTGYNAASPHPTESGALPTDTGIGFASDANTLPTLPTVYLTNVNDSDRGRYYPPNDPNTPSSCKLLDALGNATASGTTANTNGAVVVDVVKGTGTANQLPPATAPGTPPNSYGFIRFKVKVN